MKKLKQHLTTTFLFVFLTGCETVKTVSQDELANALPASAAVKVGDIQSNAKSESKPPVVAIAVKPSEPELQHARPKPEQLLAEGSELYEKGDYKAAIRKLVTVRDSAEVTPLTKQSSLRLLAFSYCVTSQRALCKNQFSTLLAIAPEFQLSRGEAGHPLWGPVFKEAKSEKIIKPPKRPKKVKPS